MATINADDLLEAVQDNMFGDGSTGFCKVCGEARDGCEGDAENYECYSCGARKVFGAERLLIMGYGST